MKPKLIKAFLNFSNQALGACLCLQRDMSRKLSGYIGNSLDKGTASREVADLCMFVVESHCYLVWESCADEDGMSGTAEGKDVLKGSVAGIVAGDGVNGDE